jgi:hypothetical protein
MPAPVFPLLLLALVLTGPLAACGERPPRADPEAHSYNDQPLPTPMRDRTLRQGERQ